MNICDPFHIQDTVAHYNKANWQTGKDKAARSSNQVRAFLIAGPVLVEVVTSIIDLSISTNIFPSTWKITSVTPIFKSGDHDDPNNYRPISLLSIISKLTERVVHDQVYAFLRSNSFFNDAQSGFRKGHSTTTCLLDFLDGIYNDIENGVVSGVLFLDLRKTLYIWFSQPLYPPTKTKICWHDGVHS